MTKALLKSKKMNLIPNFKLFKHVMKLCGSDESRWIYQKIAAKFFFNHDKIILHQARQTGKTYLASILVACYMLCGLSVVIAFSTLKQGKALLLLEVQKRLYSLQHIFPSLLKFIKNNQEGILCANGGRVIILTTNDKAKSNEGYSANLIVIDEAHQADKSVMDEIFPITFAQTQAVKVLLLGIGGYRNSLITDQKKKGCVVCKLDGEYIASVYPPYADKLVEARQSLSSEGFDAQIMCLDRLSGEKSIFDEICECISEEQRGIGKKVRYAGIDPAFIGDETVVTIGDICSNDKKQILDFMAIKGDWKVQAAEIVDYLRKWNVPDPYVMIESNAIGQALIEAMSVYSPSYNNMNINAKNKPYLINYARQMMRDGELAIKPKFMREHLLGLILETKDDGTVHYEHSDYLSSLLMFISNFIYG